MGALAFLKENKYSNIQKENHITLLKLTLSKLKATKNPIYNEIKKEHFTYLGRGNYAYAYKIGKYCFKITSDEADAIMSSKIKQTNLNHIVYTYEVFRHKSNYIIISEALNDFPKEGKYSKFFVISSDIAREMRFYFKYKEITAEVLYTRLVNTKKIINVTEEIAKEVVSLCETLIHYDFRNIDIHPDNIKLGFDGFFKVIDLGHFTSDNPIFIEEL